MELQLMKASMEVKDSRNIAANFATAIMYGDITGLTDDEDAMLDDWIEQFGVNDYPLFDGIEEPFLAMCDITKCLAECLNVKIYWQHP